MIQGRKVIAFITAAGTGTRMQLSIPKQFLTIDDIPVCFYLMRHLQRNEMVDEIAIAIPHGWHEYVKTFAEYLGVGKLKHIVLGGDTIFKSIANMVEEVNSSNGNYVACINDGDRFIFDNVLDAVLQNFSMHGNTIPYWMPYEITFYDDESGVRVLDRDKVMISSTPHVFNSEHLTNAIKYAKETGKEDMYIHQLFNEIGIGVDFLNLPTSRYDIKLTYQHDMDVINAILKHKGKE